MYCPTCFSNTLKILGKGVVKIELNKKHRDANLMLYNLSHDGKERLPKDLMLKFNEFLSWYSCFQNPDPISEVNLHSNSFECTSGCSIDVNAQLSIADIILSRKEILAILKECCNKYNIGIDPNVEIL